MAYIGLRNPIWAKIEGTEVEGQPLSYGEACSLGGAIMAEVSFTRSDAAVYANDKLHDRDNSITGGTVRLNVADVPNATRKEALGMKEGSSGEMIVTGRESPYGGIGYTRVRREKGVTTYEGTWLYKTQLGETTITSNTKGERTEFATPTLEGALMGVVPAEDLEVYYVAQKEFDTIEEADNWVRSHASTAATGQVNQ